MAAIVNDRDVLLQAASVRKLTTAGVAVVPTPSSYNFYLRADGSHGPDYVRISVATILCDGPFTFAVQGATKLSNITATTADIAFADLTSALAIVTVTAANAGTPVQGSCIIGLVSDGQQGQNGTRGAGVYYATGGGWSDTVAKAACPGGVAIAGDVVTISNGATYALTKKYDGSVWAALGGVYDGSLFVTGSIQAAAINSNGLILRDLQGRPILGAGAALSADYFGATVGGDNLCPNSSFEVATNGVMADGWSIYNNNASGEPATSSIEAGRLGGRALAVSWSPTHTSQKGIRRAGAVPQWVPGATYVVSWYAKTSNLSGPFGTYLEWNTRPANSVELMNPALSTSWQRYAFRITWGSSVEGGGNLYVTVALGGGNGNVYFDDLMIVEGDVLPAYYPSAAEAKAAADAAQGVASSAQTTANNAMTAIANISSDNILSKGEKSEVVVRWQACDADKAALVPQAAAVGVSSTAYVAAHKALSDYLVSIPLGWSDANYDSPISALTWNALWNSYYSEKSKLLAAMNNATFLPLGRGTALNEDPTIEKLSSWVMTGNVQYKTDTSGAGTTSNRYFLSLTTGLDGLAYTRSAVTIDPTKTYNLSANVFQGNDNDRALWIFVDFYDAAGNWFPGSGSGSTGWGGGHSGYSYGGVPPGGWSRQGGQFGAGTSRPIPANARIAVVGVWFNYSGSGTANVGQVQAAQDIRLEQVISMALIDPAFQANLQDKISKTAASALQAPITLATSGLMLAGTTSNGVYMSPGGLFGVQNGAYTFAIPISGDPSFAGSITAKSGTLGSLTLAPGGFIAQGYYGTWDWAAKASGPGFLIHQNGMLFGDYNNPSYGYVQISANGTLSMPGFDYSSRQLTLTQPILVNPKTQTSLSLTLPSTNLRNQSGSSVTVNVSPSIANGSGSYAYQWSVTEDNNRITISGSATGSSVTLKASGSNIAFQGQVSLTIRDLNTQAIASNSASVYIQFGNGQLS